MLVTLQVAFAAEAAQFHLPVLYFYPIKNLLWCLWQRLRAAWVCLSVFCVLICSRIYLYVTVLAAAVLLHIPPSHSFPFFTHTHTQTHKHANMFNDA